MDDKESLGKYLQRERETRKISLREIAGHTRIREPFLKAIEEDQFHLLPSSTYLKGFLLTYAKYIGLDPNDVLLRYESLSKGEEPAGHPEALPEKRMWRNRKHLVTAGGAIALGFIALYFFLNLSRPSVESISMKPEIEKPLPSPPSPQPVGTPSAPEGEPLSLRLKAVEKTWVRMQLNDQPEQEMTFQPGEGRTYREVKQIRLIVGNAGGLDLIFNGRPLEKFGASGEVVTLIFTPQGVEARRHDKPQSP